MSEEKWEFFFRRLLLLIRSVGCIFEFTKSVFENGANQEERGNFTMPEVDESIFHAQQQTQHRKIISLRRVAEEANLEHWQELRESSQSLRSLVLHGVMISFTQLC